MLPLTTVNSDGPVESPSAIQLLAAMMFIFVSSTKLLVS